MAVNSTHDSSTKLKTAKVVRNWATVAITAGFFMIYASALFGWYKPISDERWVAHVEPIILLAVGYCLGRLPARRAEEAFNDAVSRQAQKADAAQHAKELAQQAREALEERTKNVKTILSDAMQLRGRSSSVGSGPAQVQADEAALRHSIFAVLSILDS